MSQHGRILRASPAGRMLSRLARTLLDRRHALRGVAAFTAAAMLLPPATAAASPYVYVDPGHGGPYNHVNAFGLREKHVNLWIGRELRTQLLAQGFRVGMTRDTDTALTTRDINTWHWDSVRGIYRFYKDGKVMGDPPPDDLQARCNVANAAGADVFISIHGNASSSGRARGTETWASPTDPLGIQLSKYVQKAVIEQTGMVNRGSKITGFYVLRWTNMPAILIESGFLTNRTDARLLSSPTFRAKMARGIVIGLKRWLATDPFRPLYQHHGGATPADVAAAASSAGYPAGADTALLISSDDATAAMTVAPLARKLRAPVLVAGASGVPTATAAELARLAPRRLIAIAPPAALPDAVLEAASHAATAPIATERLAGEDQYQTAALVAEAVGVPSSGRVVIASGEVFADALCASAIATGEPAPILLTRRAAILSPEASSFLSAHAAEASQTLVVGGATAVWPAAVASLPRVTRLGGVDWYQDNVAVLRAIWPSGELRPYVCGYAPSASGVVAAAAAATTGRPLLVTGGRVLSTYSREWVQNVHGRIKGWTLVGTGTEQPVLADQILRKAAQ